MSSTTHFSKALLKWFDKFGRTDLPWQHPRTLYRVWVSEIMLQQTQVITVMRYFDTFMTCFPTVETLAQATMDDVLSKWSGLGYYARARNLWKSAKIICNEMNGVMPTSIEKWMALPGVGRSTAGAILAQSLNHRVPILDGNVKRVLSRYIAFNECVDDKNAELKLWDVSAALLPKTRLADHTQALMDLGATLCKKSSPNCDHCPLQKNCVAYQNGTVAEYPIRKIKKAIPTKKSEILIIQNRKQEIFLVRRPDSGIWGGLWSLPELASIKNQPKKMEKLNIVKHAFTHYKLILQPYFLQHEKCNIDSGNWFSIYAALGLGLPAPIRKILLMLASQQETCIA